MTHPSVAHQPPAMGPQLVPPAPPTPDPAPMPPASGVTAVRLAALAVLALAAFGFILLRTLQAVGLDRPLRGSLNVFHRLFALHELVPLLTLGAFALAALLLARTRDVAEPDGAWWTRMPAWLHGARWPLVAALVVLAVTWAGTALVMHGFPLSMDEYNAAFQARVFASGRTAGLVPAGWREWVHAMLPVFTVYRPATGEWMSLYLPVYAAIRAAFLTLHLESLTNPLMAAVSVVAIAGIARRLWPEAPRRSLVAVVLLATSSQFLVTSMSAYSMPAHLALNLVWLWLWLRDDRRSIAVLPVVGVLALGLHNPFPHALFVAPFLLRRLRERRWGTLAWLAVVYGAGSLVWLLQLRALREGLDAGGMSDAFALPNLGTLWTQLASLAMLAGWQTPVLAIAAGAALFSWRRLEPVVRDIALGVILTVAFYCVFPANQGHGWGYRYAHAVLGNLVLVATAGLALLAQAMGRARTARLVAASLAVSLLVQLPLRAVQVERFVRPFADASAWIASLPDEVVIVPTNAVWYGRDLVRNDPFLAAGPKVLSMGALTAEDGAELGRRNPGRMRIVTAEELTRFGLELTQAAAAP